jgi:hypothetical protein
MVALRKIHLMLMILIAVLIVAGCATALPDSQLTEDSAQSEPTGAEATEPRDALASVPVSLLPPESPPFNTNAWTTDFDRRTVEWSEILSGGVPKDGIPAIDDPLFEDVASAGEWLAATDPIILFQHNGEARGYPLSILIWHEIVNDTVGDTPVTVTFCPLCNASIVFERVLGGEVLDFGTTGNLRNSDLIMYDRQSETWWQQFTGEGIVGTHAGRQLDFMQSQVISFADFAAEFPDGEMLARPPASRSYGNNPYVGYDSRTERPFLYTGELDGRLNPTERVVGLKVDGDVIAYPFSAVEEAGVINDEVGGTLVAVMHKSGTASALDGREIATSRDVGSVGVFSRQLGDQILTFEANGDGAFVDVETGSTWNILGEAIGGNMAGESLDPLLSFDHFWFAWTAFFPDTDLYGEVAE